MPVWRDSKSLYWDFLPHVANNYDLSDQMTLTIIDDTFMLCVPRLVETRERANQITEEIRQLEHDTEEAHGRKRSDDQLFLLQTS